MTNIELLLFSISKLASGTQRMFTVEEIVVNAFKMFPNIFSIKGFINYPDSAQVEKRIYDNLQPKGYIRVVNRKVQLTKFGLEKCHQLNKSIKRGKPIEKFGGVLTKQEIQLYKKLISLEGFNMFMGNRDTKLLDIDIYQFYEATVRTSTTELTGKINIVSTLLKKAFKLKMGLSEELNEYKDKLDSLYKGLLNDKNKSN